MTIIIVSVVLIAIAVVLILRSFSRRPKSLILSPVPTNFSRVAIIPQESIFVRNPYETNSEPSNCEPSNSMSSSDDSGNGGPCDYGPSPGYGSGL